MSDDTSSAPPAEQRRLAAIMFTDIVGFSRQMGANEARTLRLLALHNQLIQQSVAEHHGAVIKTVGDAFLVDFPSVVHAVQCAQQIHAQFRAHNTEKESAEQIHVRIGIHLGDIVQQNGDVFGDGVNVASRLQGLAEPDTICISQIVYNEVVAKLTLGAVVPLGKPKLKNIAQRFGVYLLLSARPTGLRQRWQTQRLKLSRRGHPVVLVFVSVLLLGGLALLLFPVLPTFILQHSSFSIRQGQPPLPLPDKPSIVVLPFVNMSDDPQQDYFSDGITEDITADLSKISSLFVIARNSAFTYKGKAVKVQDVSREMGVRYVLEGSVRKADGKVRITVQLVDGTTGGQLWSERYDRPLKDIFAVQDEIRQKIITTLKLQLTLWERGVQTYKSTDNPEAYDAFLRGLAYYWRFTKEAQGEARQFWEQAIALDPQYTEAYAYLGRTYAWEWILQWSHDSQALEKAATLARKAVTLDESLPSAHQLLGQVYLFQKRHDQAIAEAERAVTLAPNDAEGYLWLGWILNYAGQSERGLATIQQALRLNPQHPPNYSLALGQIYRQLRQYEEAIVAFKTALGRNPNLPASHIALAALYGELGQVAEAKTEAAELLKLNPMFSLEVYKERWPAKDPATLERHIAALRKAGLK